MADTRPFAFRNGTALEARLRQEGLCAVCGRSLDNQEEFGHHVVPNQCGNPADPSHEWLRTVLNCVVVCHSCHMRVHQDGKTSKGAVAPPGYFRWSHKKRAHHRAWAQQVDTASNAIWNYLQQKTATSGIQPASGA